MCEQEPSDAKVILEEVYRWCLVSGGLSVEAGVLFREASSLPNAVSEPLPSNKRKFEQESLVDEFQAPSCGIRRNGC